MARTTRWLERCRKAWRPDSGTSLFGIVQGGLHEDLRKRHVEEVCAVDLPGYALGGYAVIANNMLEIARRARDLIREGK